MFMKAKILLAVMPDQDFWFDFWFDHAKLLTRQTFGLTKVNSYDRYWNTKTLYHGLWARSFMPRKRFQALMAMLHIVDPTRERQRRQIAKGERIS